MNNQGIKVSIIIPVYKTEKYVEKTVLSVINQTYKNTEIVLVDDGSPDKSPEICNQLAKKYKNILVIHKKNGGLSDARNTGVANVSRDSKYIFFLDSDDTILPIAIEEMVEIAEKNNADVVMPNKYIIVKENDSKETEAVLFPKEMRYEEPKNFVLYTMMKNGRAWRATGILYKTEIIKKYNCKFPIGRIAEDVLFNLQVHSNTKKIFFYDESTIKVLKREGSITHTFHKGFEETIYYIDEVSKKFIESSNFELKNHVKILDAMLCRNLVIYLFSIMSQKNTMSKLEKKSYAKNIIMDDRNRQVFRRKNPLPWFESSKTRFAIRVVYFLLRFKLDNIALLFMSLAM